MDIFDKKGISPMLIAEQVEPYDDKDSIFELKLDGIRCIAYCDEQSTDLRNKRDMKLLPRFPELSDLYKGCKYKCILDGELNILLNGKPDFFELQKRTLLSDHFKIQLAIAKYPANYVAYDIIYYKDHLVTELPLLERKKILKDLIIENNILSVSRYIEQNGSYLFKMAKENDLEGVVGKKMNSLYWMGKRTHDWKKIKVMADIDEIAIGYIVKENNMISLILAMFDKDKNLVIRNHVSIGVSYYKLTESGMKISGCPFQTIPKGYEDAVWIEPMVCTVEYMPSNNDVLRQAIFKCFRDDKTPEECQI